MDVLQFFAQWGLPGVMIGLLCLWIWSKDKQVAKREVEHQAQVNQLVCDLKQEQKLRVADAKSYTEMALDLQSSVIKATNTIAESVKNSAKTCLMIERLITNVERLTNGSERQPGKETRRHV